MAFREPDWRSKAKRYQEENEELRRKLDAERHRKRWRPKWPSFSFSFSIPRPNIYGITIGAIMLGTAVLIGGIIYSCVRHEYYDIREGRVVDKDHHGAWVQTVHNGNTMQTIVHPERWTVTIEAGSERATWSVSEGMWSRLDFGDCYCAQDDRMDCVRCTDE